MQITVWLQLAQCFLRRKFVCEFPIGSYVKLSSAVGAILIEGLNRRTHFEMTLGWSPFKFVSVSAVLYLRWPPWLKIEISSNGQNCSILSQKVPKFELYKHNDEHFNTFEEISIFSHGGHLRYRTALTDTNLKGDHPRVISAKFGWDWLSSFRGEDCLKISSPLPVSKMAAIAKNKNFFKWPKLLYFKPESAQIWTV
jgi:hypothetical protein